MKVITYQAGCADAARIEYHGNDGLTHHILIDSGSTQAFRNVIMPDLEAISNRGEKIDLWIISHIHDDHIGGAIYFVNLAKRGLFPRLLERWLYNSPRPYKAPVSPGKDVSKAASISQGDELWAYLESQGKSSPDIIYTGKPIDIYGLKITVLSPNATTLNRLRKKYADGRVLERKEDTRVSIAAAKRKNDYDSRIESFSEHPSVDISVENGSSIAVLIEYTGHKSLWLADAHSPTITESLKALGYTKEKPLICDWVKLSHHGSAGNNLSTLYELIGCDKFIIMADGQNIYHLPSKQCLAGLLLAPNRTASPLKFHFTHDNLILRSIFAIDGHDAQSRLNFTVSYQATASTTL